MVKWQNGKMARWQKVTSSFLGKTSLFSFTIFSKPFLTSSVVFDFNLKAHKNLENIHSITQIYIKLKFHDFKSVKNIKSIAQVSSTASCTVFLLENFLLINLCLEYVF